MNEQQSVTKGNKQSVTKGNKLPLNVNKVLQKVTHRQ